MRIHIIAQPHTQLTHEYLRCAYTQKIMKLCRMLVDNGMDVTVYAGEENETPAKLVTCIKKETQRLCGYGTPEAYTDLEWDASKPIWKVFHKFVIKALRERVAPGDIIGTFSGVCDVEIKDAFPQCRFVELGIGYAGTCADFRVFESWAWLHTVYGQQYGAYQADGKFYDTVIPNYFDPVDFPYSDTHGEYILFVGRMIRRKGLQIVSDMAARMPGTLFLLAGQGATQEGSRIACQDIEIEGDNLQYIGPIDAEQRGTLMSEAKALICPTLYIGPFEGVHAEAMMCGTSVLTTPFGIFSESYNQGVQGFKCRTIREFVEGAAKVEGLDRKAIRAYAQGRYSMAVVAKQYVDYFALLDGLGRGGFYES